MIRPIEAECVLDAGCRLGEGPVWHPVDGVLEFVDITSCALHRFDPRSGRHTVRHVSQAIGAFAPRRDGGYVVAVHDGFGLLDGRGGDVEMVAPVLAGDDTVRMNDGKCDPRGRFWAGSMAYDLCRDAGAFYRLDPDLRAHLVLPSVTVSNGMDWSDDERTMYYVDSLAGGVDAYDHDAESGAIGNPRRVVDIANDSSVPAGLTVADGLTLDAEGGIWVAIHGRGEVRRYDGEGALLQVASLPAPAVTSVAFGGDDLDELYITSGCVDDGDGAVPQPFEGALFRCRPGVRGRPANLFAG